MAIISCPHCGKRISDRTEVCPHCGATLIEKDKPVISKEGIISGGKRSVLGAAAATAEAFVLARVLALIMGGVCGLYIGENSARAFREGSRAFRSDMLVILLVGLVALCILPMILEKVTKVKARTFVIAVSVVLALVFGASYISGSSALRLMHEAKDAHGYNIVGAEIASLAAAVPFFYAAALPLYQGMFFLLVQNAHGKKEYIAQAVFAGLALAITLVLVIVSVRLFAPGTRGAAFAGALAALIALTAAAFRSH